MHRHSCLQVCRLHLRTMSLLLKAQAFETESIVFGSFPDQLVKRGLPCVLKYPSRCHQTHREYPVSHSSPLSKTFATNVASSSGRDAVAYSETSASNGASTGDKAPHVPVLLQEASLCCNLRSASSKAGVWQCSAATIMYFCFQAGPVQLRRASDRDIRGWHPGRWRALCSPYTRTSRAARIGGHRQRPNRPQHSRADIAGSICGALPAPGHQTATGRLPKHLNSS